MFYPFIFRFQKLILALFLVSLALSCAANKDQASGERIPVLDYPKPSLQNTVGSFFVELPSERVNANWGPLGTNNEFQHIALTDNPLLQWKFHSRVNFYNKSTTLVSPVLRDDTLFFFGSTGHVIAVSTETGKEKWSKQLLEKRIDAAMISSGLNETDGILIATYTSGDVFALQAQTGDILWTTNLKSSIFSSPAISQNSVFIMTVENITYALNLENGTLRWIHSATKEEEGLLSPNLSLRLVDNTLFIPYHNGSLYAVDSRLGHELWSYNLKKINDGSSQSFLNGLFTPLVHQRTILVSSLNNGFSLIDLRSGQPIWEKPIRIFNTPWIAGNTIFAITPNSQLIAFSHKTGDIIWSTQLPLWKYPQKKYEKIFWSAPLLSGQHILVTNNQGQIIYVNALNGEISHTVKINVTTKIAPAISNESLFILSSSHQLYKFK